VSRGDILPDPFAESGWRPRRTSVDVLGARVDVESNHRDLLDLASRAFGGLPAHRLGSPRRLRLVLKCVEDASPRPWRQPPRPRLASGGGLLIGAYDAGNFALVSPALRTALVHVTPHALRFPQPVRHELIEFATLTLAARVQQLTSLHAACVGLRDRGLLLIGDSGAGKSTMCLAAALAGLALLSEDSVFVAADRLLATGPANFLHVRRDGLRFVDDAALRRAIAAAPTIRRRSGVRKLEVDLRGGALPVARRALRLAGVVVLSARPRGSGPVLRPLAGAAVLQALRASQAYARTQPRWDRFERHVARLPGYRLLRGSHPGEGADALRAVLESAR